MKNLLYLSVIALFSIAFIINCSTEEEETFLPPGPTQYTLTVTAGDGGTVSTDGGTYNNGTKVTITATPNEGYRFIGWEGNISTNESLTVTLNSNQTYKALFELIPIYTLTVTTSEGGTVSSEGGDYQEGTEVIITATPIEGFIFSHWSNDEEVSNINITINSNIELKANFIDENIVDDGYYIRVGFVTKENTFYYNDASKFVFKYEDNRAVFTGNVYEDLASFPVFKDIGYIPGEPDDSLTNKMVGRNLLHREYFINGNRQSWLLSKIEEDEIPNKLTHDEIMSLVKGKGFWTDPIYSKIDPLDPKSYVIAFIEDAKRHGVDLSFVDLEEISVKFRDTGYAGLSHLYCVDDNRVDISYLQAFWNSASYYDIVNERLTVMYHELGHDILNSNHPPNGELKQLMNQGLGENGNIVWDDSNEMFSFRRMVDDMFSGIGLNYTCGNGAKNYSTSSNKKYNNSKVKNTNECFTFTDTTTNPFYSIDINELTKGSKD